MCEVFNATCAECGDPIGSRAAVYVQGEFLHYECEQRLAQEEEEKIREMVTRRIQKKRRRE